jgi:hypothetical protein
VVGVSDSTKAFIVVLDQDLSEEAMQATCDALKHFRGVISVSPYINNIADVIAASRARHRLAESVYEFMKNWK